MKKQVLLKKAKKQFREGLTISIIPHSEGSYLSFTIPRAVLSLLILVIIFYMGFLTFSYRDYLNRYQDSQKVVAHLDGVRVENQKLRQELVNLLRETEELQQDLLVLQQQGRKIQELLSEDLQETEEQMAHIESLGNILNYQPYEFDFGGVGGRNNRLLKDDAFGLIQNMQQELGKMREVIPAQQEDMENLEESVREYNAIQAATPNSWPLADQGNSYISSGFGSRRDPFTGRQAFHEGVDIGVWYGTPVLATADGVVTYSGWRTGYGYTVDIDHGFGFKTRYAHNGELLVSTGQEVKRGDVIAKSGNSGRSTGPHLHYEVHVNGVPKNPLEFINKK